MSGCGTVLPDALVRSLIGAADCQATALAHDGWQGLAGSGMFAALLTALLTLAVAREGYRLLAGGGAVVPAEAVALLLRFGIVIALATSWPAYERLVARVAMDGPGEIAGAIFPAAGIDNAGLSTRLANAHASIRTTPPPPDVTPAAGKGTAPSGEAPQPDGLPGSARSTAAGMLLVTGAGPWIAARFVLALLLAIGPLAIVASLFEVSVGVTIGWLRALAGAALATLVIPLSLSIELQMLVGPVTAAARAGTPDIPGVAAILWIFALVNLALIVATQRVAGGLTIAQRWRHLVLPGGGDARETAGRHDAAMVAAPFVHLPAPAPAAPSRALAIARAAEARAIGVGGRGGQASPSASRAGAPPPPARAPRLADGAQRAAGRRTLSGKRLELGS